MEKANFMLQFAARLREALLNADYHSPRSLSGIDIRQLAKLTGHSPQICRKYLRGEAIPEPIKLIALSSKLNVSPGWLLFGDFNVKNDRLDDKIVISKTILLYIFKQANSLGNEEHLRDEIAEYLLELSTDIAQIQTNEEQLKKIINLALASANYFKPTIDHEK